ncbi:MAG: hypothetical protein IJ689_07275 [Alphaproteobacteria bacterium]|nr:hypothetical protein [Alphaproteobacteria bacterium]
MTNKTFLALLLLGVSYTAYNAVAVSENFAISTTIDHEITLGNFHAANTEIDVSKTGDMNFGTIVLNPAATEATYWRYALTGEFMLKSGDAIISADNARLGTFTANIPNPRVCYTPAVSCEGLSITGNFSRFLDNFFGGSGSSNGCGFGIQYIDNSVFRVYCDWCHIDDVSKVNAGIKTGTLTINYTPS